jgi:hypothetical protein
MTMRNIKPSLLMVLLSLPALGTIGCRSFATFSIDSRAPAGEIVIDGRSDDWAGRTYSIGDGEVSLGCQNDGRNLYICFLTGDRALQRGIMGGGLTVWFDPAGGQKKSLGIRYPLPANRGVAKGRSPEEPPAEAEAEPPETGREPGLGGAIEVITSEGGLPRKVDLESAGGIEVTIGRSSGFLVYELKIPLGKSEADPFAVGAAPGDVVGIGFETGKIDAKKEPRPEGFDRPGEEGPGSMGGPVGGVVGRGRGGMRPGAGRNYEPMLPKDIKLWAFVRLAVSGVPGQARLLSFLSTS